MWGRVRRGPSLGLKFIYLTKGEGPKGGDSIPHPLYTESAPVHLTPREGLEERRVPRRRRAHMRSNE